MTYAAIGARYQRGNRRAITMTKTLMMMQRCTLYRYRSYTALYYEFTRGFTSLTNSDIDTSLNIPQLSLKKKKISHGQRDPLRGSSSHLWHFDLARGNVDQPNGNLVMERGHLRVFYCGRVSRSGGITEPHNKPFVDS